MEWYLIRTKPGKERWVRDQLTERLPEVFLPLLEARRQRWGKLVWSVDPLFPGYLFARLDLLSHYFDVKYMQGVHGLVSAGPDPLAVPVEVVDEIRRRGDGGIVRFKQESFDSGDRVRLVGGLFNGVDAIFERYLSGPERVAVLLNAIESHGLRVIMSAAAMTKQQTGR